MGKVIQFKTKEQRSRGAAIKAINKRAEKHKLAWAKSELLKEAEKLNW